MPIADSFYSINEYEVVPTMCNAILEFYCFHNYPLGQNSYEQND